MKNSNITKLKSVVSAPLFVATTPRSKGRQVQSMPPAKRKKAPKKKPKKTDRPESWVDRSFAWRNDTSSGASPFTIISWNVLADAYCRPRSHPHLPLAAQRHIFNRNERQLHVRKILEKCTSLADIVALQEVDAPLGIRKAMESFGFEALETPAEDKSDACGLYFRKTVWDIKEQKVVRLDDLAFLGTTLNHNLQGLQSSFVRKNKALLVRLQEKRFPHRDVVVGVVHLYWNPMYEYVKVRFVICDCQCSLSIAQLDSSCVRRILSCNKLETLAMVVLLFCVEIGIRNLE